MQIFREETPALLKNIPSSLFFFLILSNRFIIFLLWSLQKRKYNFCFGFCFLVFPPLKRSDHPLVSSHMHRPSSYSLFLSLLCLIWILHVGITKRGATIHRWYYTYFVLYTHVPTYPSKRLWWNNQNLILFIFWGGALSFSKNSCVKHKKKKKNSKNGKESQ